MARSTMEVAFLGTQKTPVDSETYYKLFYGDQPDGTTEHGLSIISMGIAPEVGEQIFQAGQNFAPLEAVRITFEVERGGQNKGKNIAVAIEAVKPTGQRPAAQPTPTKPTEPAKG